MGRVIGLTGGIGSGKSLVAGLLGERGAVVIDADRVAHEVYRPGSDGWHAVVAAFGREILNDDGGIARRRLGDVVFSDTAARRRLNTIVHPRVRALLVERIAGAQCAGASVVVVEVPLLIEAIRAGGGWARTFDEIWVVTAPQAQVMERLRVRGMDAARVRAVIGAQARPEQRLPYADVVIDNAAAIDQLRDRVAALWEERLERW